MTDSTIDTHSGDGGFDVGSSADDLFGEIESDGTASEGQRGEPDDGDESDAVEDRTAADVFDQLRTDVGDGDGADDILADESPDDIIASADEPDPEADETVDDDLLADDDELADFLLTGRTKEQEFLWIETDGSDETGEPSAPDGSSEAAVETETDSEPPTADTDSGGNVDEPATADEADDELVERLFGDGSETDSGSDEATAADADTDGDEATAIDAGTESDSPSNSSIAVSDRDRGTDSSVETDVNGPVAEEAESDSASERSDDAETADDGASDDGETSESATADDGSSGFFGRLLSIIGGLF